MRKTSFFVPLLIICMAAFILGELMIFILSPRVYMYPRMKFSAQYGFMLYENCRMVHGVPWRWKVFYTINEYQYRGESVLPAEKYDKTNIVILGDSYSFGYGVNDSATYPAVIAAKLENDFNVINLATPGWGLTQHIRRYYEFGRLYLPRIVILQFHPNDPEENLENKVTAIENKKFKFQDSGNTFNLIKKYLSRSIIQKSQIYNLFRESGFRFFERRAMVRSDPSRQTGGGSEEGIYPGDDFYNELLELFAKDLRRHGSELIMISTNGGLEQFPKIKAKVSSLSSRGFLAYYDVRPWLKDVSGKRAPDGHLWGKEAHYILGERLSEIIRR
ncbi:SGNH/GDSL hydrolase family protein [Candidatus Omnitrophota bacterium]